MERGCNIREIGYYFQEASALTRMRSMKKKNEKNKE